MHIVICDDDERICLSMKSKIRELFPLAMVESFTSGEALFSEASSAPDILMLDILMPGTDGIECARKLRDNGWNAILIFITGEKDRVFDAFDVHPFHYLVKPFSEEKLASVLSDAISVLDKKNSRRGIRFIEIQSGGEHIRIDLAKLMYAEVYDRKLILHTREKTIEYYGRLAELEKLTGKDFYRIHRSYLINLRYVDRYTRESITLTNGDIIPIARRSHEGFLQAYLAYGRRRN